MSTNKMLIIPSLATGGLIIGFLDLFINGSRIYQSTIGIDHQISIHYSIHYFNTFVFYLLGTFGLLYGIFMKKPGHMMPDLMLSGLLAFILLINLLLVLFEAAFSVDSGDSIRKFINYPLIDCKFREDPFKLLAHHLITIIAFYWYTFLVKLSLFTSMMITDAENNLAELRLDRI